MLWEPIKKGVRFIGRRSKLDKVNQNQSRLRSLDTFTWLRYVVQKNSAGSFTVVGPLVWNVILASLRLLAR